MVDAVVDGAAEIEKRDGIRSNISSCGQGKKVKEY